MLVRNLLKAGDYVEPIPVGLPITLKYEHSGNLGKVYIGYDSANFIDSKISYSHLIKSAKVPSRLGTNGGTLYVKGILYTGLPLNTLGEFPEAYQAELESQLLNSTNFNFFAGTVESTSINFTTSLQVRMWLQSQGFNMLPGLIVPLGDIDFALRNQMGNTPFLYDYVIGFFIFRGGKAEISFLNKRQDRIVDSSVYLDSFGHIRSLLSLESGEELSISYYELISNHYYPGDYIILDETNCILAKRWDTKTSEKHVTSSVYYECPFCGKQYKVEDEFTVCPDIHCFSTMYPNLKHFLNRLNLVPITYDRYLELIHSGKFSKFSDILLAPEYSDLQIEVSIYDLLDAIIPIAAVRNRDAIWNLYSVCNGSWESIAYYMTHPQSMALDLKITDVDLAKWFQYNENRENVFEIIQYANIIIIPVTQKFEGSPIFRGKTIYLTGKFLHGSLAEVSSILRSYSAEIGNFDVADCAILGDIPEDVNGVAISYLKNSGKPIFTESEFFSLYEIDSDLA